MATWEFQVKGLEATLRRFDPKAFRKELRAAAKPLVEPIRKTLRRIAPRGRTGKLRRAFRVRIRTRVGEVEVAIVAAPHAHLVDRGHAIIPRGPSRQGLGLASQDTLSQRRLRGRLRGALLSRQSGGSQGFVPGRQFTLKALQAHGGEPGIARQLEAILVAHLRG